MTCHSSRARSPTSTTSSASRESGRQLEDTDHDRRLRQHRRHPGAAQLRRRRGVHADRLRDSRSSSTRSPLRPPMSEHVPVDFELQGCPIDKHQLLEVISALLHRRRPRVRSHSVCIECKRRGTVCVMVAHGTPCLGPVTHAGCGAICPSYDRGCYGCFGPMETPNTESLNAWRRGSRIDEPGPYLQDLQRDQRALPR